MQKLRYCNIREGPRARKDGLRDMPGSLYLSHLFSRDQCTVVGVKLPWMMQVRDALCSIPHFYSLTER